MTTRTENLKIDLKHKYGDFEASNSGDILRSRGKENLDQAMIHRLLTVKGSLAHRPNYGVGVMLWQGQITSLDKKRDLALQIKEQFEMDERIEKVNSVQFESDDNSPDKFLIFVKYSAVGYNELESTLDPFELGI